MAYRFPPLSTFLVFEAAARHLSFRRAAEELHVTPSAVSQQIKSLESYLGVMLFERLPGGLQLTQQGVSLIAGVREGLECFATGIEQIRQVKSRTLTISAPPNFATRWLAHRVAAYSAGFPDVAIRVISDPDLIDGPLTLTRLAQQPVDPRQGADTISICFGAGNYPGHKVERLLTPHYVLACSPALLDADPPLRTLKDLRRQVFIHDEALPDEDKRPSWREWLQKAGVKGVNPDNGPRYSNSVLVHEAVLAGQGLALLVDTNAEADVRAGRLAVPFPITLPAAYSYYLVFHERDMEKPEVKAFRDWILAEIQS
ncbi:LysR substrate-binding domain-containing protein [Propionivibrio sp.]|uniref:LysR substrate-binding domain-containing protein n=1 Tax=Propionivibrio sp. TaxID=2212460 RepID=UPI0039E6FE33